MVAYLPIQIPVSFSLHPYYPTGVWHKPDSELQAVTNRRKKKKDSNQKSISYKKPARFDIVFSSPSPAHQYSDDPQMAAAQQAGMMWQDMEPPWQYVDVKQLASRDTVTVWSYNCAGITDDVAEGKTASHF